ncbi:MAG: alpha/beta hydrolase [Rectinemataceae bacterium]|nr:alpha/beta hydrolase [Rectinemataceae bacterium]
MPRAIVCGTGIRYEIVGPAGGETVALLNGIAMSIGHWKPIADALVAAGYRVLLHDMRGQLLSDKTDEVYSLEGHARDFAGLLEVLGLGAARVIGTSYGAEVGLCFARDFPALTKTLVLIDGAAGYDEVLGMAIESWKAAALADPLLFYKSILPWNYSGAWIRANREILRKREMEISSLPREYFESFARLCDSFLRIDLAKDLDRIATPVLVIVGDADILKPPRYSRALAEGIKGARYAEIPGAGHAVAIERPVEVARLALEFMRGT